MLIVNHASALECYSKAVWLDNGEEKTKILNDNEIKICEADNPACVTASGSYSPGDFEC